MSVCKVDYETVHLYEKSIKIAYIQFYQWKKKSPFRTTSEVEKFIKGVKVLKTPCVYRYRFNHFLIINYNRT